MFSPYMVSGSFVPASAGQPFVHRLFGIPTAVGFRGRWNLILPFLALVEMLHRWRS